MLVFWEQATNSHELQKFITDETITGGTSGATATLTEYRANPVQNIQQLLEYANTDNTIFDFLDKMRISFIFKRIIKID